MAVLGAWADGNWSNTATWATLIQSTMSQASTGTALSGTPTYSNTLTALNLTDSWRGLWLPFYNFATGNTVSVVLQEYNGATWSDTTATATLYSYSFNVGQRWGFAKFGTPYTPTTTSSGYYRLKITRASGSGNVNIYGSSASTPSCMIASASPASAPGTGYSTYMRMPGSSGNYAYAADSAALSITGDIDIRVRLSLDSWSTANQTIIAKYVSTGTQGSFILGTGTSSKLFLALYNSAGSGGSATSSTGVSFTAGQAGWIRVTYRTSDKRVQFFEAADSTSMPSSWTQVGTDVTHTIGDIKDTTSPLEIGSCQNGASGGGTGLSNATGNFYWAQIRNNVADDGTGIQFSADITTKLFGTSSFIEASANAATVTVAGSLSQDGDDVLIAGDMTNAAGTTNTVTVTVDTNATVGSGQNLAAFGGSSGTMFNAINMDAGGRLKASRSASTTLLVKQLIYLAYTDAQLDYGTISDRIPAAYTATLMFDPVNNYTGVGIRYSNTAPNNTAPYYLGFVGAEKTYVKTNYVSGIGTAASPLVTADAVDWNVGDQIVVTPSAGYTTYSNTAPAAAAYTDATGYARRYITLTFAASHSFKVGDRIVMSGFTPSTYNGTWTVDEVPTSTTLRIYNFTTAITANATVMGTVAGHTSKSEYRYIKTKNSSTSYVLSTISGGAEDALQYSPTTKADIYNLSSNVRVTVNKRNQSYMYTFDASGQGTTTSPTHWVLDNCRLDYAGVGTAYSLGILVNGYTSANSSATINKVVFWAASTVIYDSASSHSDWTISDVIFAGYGYGASTNGIYAGGYNKTFTRVYSVDRSNTPITILGSNNIFRTIRMWSTAPEGNSAPGITITANAANNQIIGAYVQGIATGSSSRGVTLGNGVGNKFLDSEFGSVVANNNADVYITSNTYNICVFENCKFSSGTFISNYLNMFDGSLVAFHKYQQTTNKHRWYTNAGSARSTGAGLDDTTVRTAGSLNVRIDPENATTGFKMEFKIPSIVNQQTFINGFMQKNATFGTSVAKVEMWLPGSDTTSTADATYTLDNTTGSYQTFSVNKDYTGTANGLSTIRITAITATAGAYLYVADIYNGQGALNLWDNGQPVSPIVPLDFSSIPGLVWTFPDTNTTASTMGRALKDRLSKNQFLGLK